MLPAQRTYDAMDFEVACRRAAHRLSEASELACALKDYELAAQLLDQKVLLVKLSTNFSQRPTQLIAPTKPRQRRPAAR